MIVQVSRATRRIVGRLERGERIHEALVSLASTHGIPSGSVSGVGLLEEAQVVAFDAARRQYGAPRTLRGPLQVIALNGNLSVADGNPFAMLFGLFARETDTGGLEVVGGQLVAARVYALELSIDCWDDAPLVREPDEATGLALWARTAAGSQIAPPPSPAPRRSGAAPSFASTVVLGASDVPQEIQSPPRPNARRATMPPPPSEAAQSVPPPPPPPRSLAEAARVLDTPPGRPLPVEVESGSYDIHPGDLVEHPSFGPCEVEAEPEPGRLRIRVANGQRREILLDVLEVTPKGTRGSQRVFGVRPKRR